MWVPSACRQPRGNDLFPMPRGSTRPLPETPDSGRRYRCGGKSGLVCDLWEEGEPRHLIRTQSPWASGIMTEAAEHSFSAAWAIREQVCSREDEPLFIASLPSCLWEAKGSNSRITRENYS